MTIYYRECLAKKVTRHISDLTLILCHKRTKSKILTHEKQNNENTPKKCVPSRKKMKQKI